MAERVLSQEEVDALLEAAEKGRFETDIQGEDSNVVRYDFRRPSRLSREKLRGLKIVHEEFCRDMGSWFSSYLRSFVEVEIISMDEVIYEELIKSMPNPTCIGVVDMSPLPGNGMIEMSFNVVFPLIDRLLGGPGTPANITRELTPLEERIMAKTFHQIIRHLKNSWNKLLDSNFSLVGVETNPELVQVVSGNETVLVIGFNVKMENAEGVMSFCIPTIILESVLAKVGDKQAHQGHHIALDVEAMRAIERGIKGTDLTLSVVLGKAYLRFHQLSLLKEGDVIRLDRKQNEEVELLVEGHKCFAGKVGKVGNSLGVLITRIITQEGGE